MTFSAPNLRAIMKELKVDGQSRIDDAIRGGGAPAPSKAVAKRTKPEKEVEEVEVDVDDEPAEKEPEEREPPPPAADFAGNERARGSAKKKKQAAFAFARSSSDSGDADRAPARDDAEEARPARPKKKVEAAPALDIDADEGAAEASSEEPEASEAEPKPATSKARSWSAGEDKPSEAEAEDDGRAAFLSDDSAGEGAQLGEDDGGSASSGSGSSSADPTVIMGLNAGFVRRTLSYSDDLYGRLRAPSANSWVYRLQAAVYPFAKPVKDRIGLVAGYESEFSGVVRDNAAGTDFGVNFSEIYGGLKLRQPLGVHELALEGTIGSMQAGLDDPDGTSGVPGISYTTLRAALDAGLHFGSLAMRGSLGYRLPIGGYGQASEVRWFPRMEASGIEGSLGLEYRITKEVAFDVSATMRRYLLQMNSRPEDAETGASEVAGGAVDLYLGGYFGLNITL